MRKLPRHTDIFKSCPVAAENASGTDAPLFTAIPIGKSWRVKAIGCWGETTLLGLINGRLPASVAAARVVP